MCKFWYFGNACILCFVLCILSTGCINTRQGYNSKSETQEDQYMGEYKDGKKYGQGTMFYSDGEYVGEWKDDKRNGQGTFTWKDGAKYEGEWKDDKRNGQGTITYASNDSINRLRYVGEWKDDNRHGQGTLTWKDGQKYEGEWKDDKCNGQGTHTWKDGEKYVGEWKDGKYNGQGTYTYTDGAKYEGEWKDGHLHGQGTYTYANGSKYVGEYKDGCKHGQGTMTYADGSKCVGEWKYGNRNGYAVVTLPDGRVLVHEYLNDEITSSSKNEEKMAEENPELLVDQILFKIKKYNEDKKYNEAIWNFKKLVLLKIVLPKSFYFDYGVTLFKAKRYTEAREQFLEYINKEGRNSEFYVQVLEYMHNIDEEEKKK